MSHGVRRSVLLRLVAVSLVVATCSIAAAAWITTRSTSSQIRSDQQRSLEVDNQIYDAVIEYGRANASWDGVGPVLDELAASTGRTIVLQAADGQALAAAAPDGAPAGVPPGAAPTAPIDPLAPMVLGADNAPLDRTLKFGVDLPAAVSVLSATELDERRQRAAKASACAAGFDVNWPVVTGDDGAARVEYAAADGAPDKVYAVCSDPLLDAPGAREIGVLNQIADSTATCLRGQGYDPSMSSPSDAVPGPRTVFLEGGTADASAALHACQVAALRSAAEPYVAPPALLFLSSDRVQPSWFESAGGTRIVFVLLAVLLVTILLTALGASRILRPIRSLTNAAQRMAGGDLGTRVRIRGGDEVARLGTAFNAMADAIERDEQQRKSLVSDVAHELRNPLANVRGYLEGAQDDVVRMDAALVDSLLEETLLLQHLIDDLQDLALADAGRLRVHPEPSDARALAEQVVAAHRSHAERAGVTLVADGDPVALLDADPVRLRQALGNLVANALRYTPPDGSVTVHVHTEPRDIVFEVADTGSGIAADHLPHLFDRFYRADASRSRDTGGSGLGLAITRHLVEAHGGTIGVASKVGSGTRFTIRVPRTTTRQDRATVRRNV